MGEIGSGDVANMTDATSAGLLADLNSKRKQTSLGPFVAALAAVVMSVFLWNALPAWAITVAVVTLLGCCIVAYLHDLHTKTLAVLYDLDVITEEAFNQLCSSLHRVSECGGAWHIDATANVYDSKYNAGSEHVINRSRIGIDERQPPLIKSNVSPLCLPLGHISLYFFPDRILVYGSNDIGAIGYEDFHIMYASSRFVEEGPVPSDAQVVDHKWHFINKDGGPDLRFKGNWELPICLYEEIRLLSATGLRERVQVSRVGIGEPIEKSLELMVKALAQLHSTESVRQRMSQHVRNTPALVGNATHSSTENAHGTISDLPIHAICMTSCLISSAALSFPTATFRAVKRRV